MYSYWRDLHVQSGCVCIDERVAIPHSIQDAVLEILHLTHPGSWVMITLGQYAFWPYMHREILDKAAQQKTTNVTPFQAHFGRKPNTPLSNIRTIPKSSNLSYESILHHYLDADTVPVEDYLDNNEWVSGSRSDIFIEEAMQKVQVDAGRRYNGEHNKLVSRFILHPKLNNLIPWSEKLLDLKLARKLTKRSKRDLRGLWETLAPGSNVERTSDTTTVIKEPGVHEVRVRNSDIAKVGTRAERNTDIWQYAQLRPLPHEKTTEEKVSQHMRDLKKKYRGEINIRHRPTQSDAATGVSSANSNISKSMDVITKDKEASSRRKTFTTTFSIRTQYVQCLFSCCIVGRILLNYAYYFKVQNKSWSPRLFWISRFSVLC